MFISTDAAGTGLNLQSASALINLDMPWNPAVLNRRIARIHRLGQSNKVQIILMVAKESYVQRVAALVNEKHELFDNVMDSEAGEDVVGVSKRVLEKLIEGFAETTDAESAAVAAEADELAGKSVAEVDNHAGAQRTESLDQVEDDRAIGEIITRIQSNFGARLERVLGVRGGLLVVIDHVDEESERTARELSETVPIALTDARTMASVERLGQDGLPGETRAWFDRRDETGDGGTHPLLVLARQKLDAADVLMDQTCTAAPMELLASSMLAAAAAQLGRAIARDGWPEPAKNRIAPPVTRCHWLIYARTTVFLDLIAQIGASWCNVRVRPAAAVSCKSRSPAGWLLLGGGGARGNHCETIGKSLRHGGVKPLTPQWTKMNGVHPT